MCKEEQKGNFYKQKKTLRAAIYIYLNFASSTAGASRVPSTGAAAVESEDGHAQLRPQASRPHRDSPQFRSYRETGSGQ
jgi:hypothetical protein